MGASQFFGSLFGVECLEVLPTPEVLELGDDASVFFYAPQVA